MEIKTLQVGPIGTNCYILCDETEKICAVIDPGGDAPRVAAAVQATGCAPCAILLTHGHYDHGPCGPVAGHPRLSEPPGRLRGRRLSAAALPPGPRREGL